MKTNNKKGMSLVEVIVAMAVFSVMTTGFMMTAIYCVKAQNKAKLRLKESNGQTTEIEDFKGLYDTDTAYMGSDIQKPGGSNLWTMSYNFPEGSYVNDRVHFYAYNNTDLDDAFQMQFFSPDESVDLKPNEYWVTIYNCSGDQVTWDITCDSGFVFFDNEGQTVSSLTTIPTRIVDDGAKIKFGIRNIGGGDITQAVTLTDWNSPPNVKTLNLSNDTALVSNPYSDSDRYAGVYFTGSNSFLNAEQYDAIAGG